MAFVLVEDVLYVPSAGYNLFSPELVLEQGFTMTWKPNTKMFGMTTDKMDIMCTMHERHL